MIDLDLDRLNSLTKYPSIPTYHKMGDKGRLTEEYIPFDGQILVTEKIDGTNSRIILFPHHNDYIIGNREELLYARGDRIINPTLSIVPTLIPWAEHILEKLRLSHRTNGHYMYVIYGETYGGNITKGSQSYTSKGSTTTAWRVFDVMRMGYTYMYDILHLDKIFIAQWRDSHNQPFEDIYAFRYNAGIDLETVPAIPITYIPTGIAETYEWLQRILPESRARIDEGGTGRPEGVVIRTPDRSKIAKLRFEDYERTLRQR